ncbi:hypothetical protein [Micromonospora parva]|uniref:hypothetical protein n=1 Tax=Micromonospora parva TaxID=1464048 RepID=UPI0033D9B88C
MTSNLLPAELQHTTRKLRLVAILDSCRRAGLSPTNVSVVHSIAYLADALAPVWHLPILDGQLLKRSRRPFFPSLQSDLDKLVGCGLVGVARFSYLHSEEATGSELDADYYLIPEAAQRVIEVAQQFREQSRKLDFVREVVLAASGLGPVGIANVGLLDAAYSNPYVDVGEVLDIDKGAGTTNDSATTALRFAELTQGSLSLSDAEMVHLYVRHLYTRMQVA